MTAGLPGGTLVAALSGRGFGLNPVSKDENKKTPVAVSSASPVHTPRPAANPQLIRPGPPSPGIDTVGGTQLQAQEEANILLEENRP